MASKARTSPTANAEVGDERTADTESPDAARITAAIQTVAAEIAAIQARQRQLAADRSALQARLMAATLREQRLRADLAQGPEALAATRAALLVASGPTTQADVARQLTDLQRTIGEWKAELEALVGPDGSGGALESDLARLADLEQVQAALQDELRAAQARLGNVTYDRLVQEYEEHHARAEAARAALEAALADERGVVARMGYELAPWPALRGRALVEHPTDARRTPRARLAAAALSYFSTLEETSEQLGDWMLPGGENVIAAFSLDLQVLQAMWGKPAWRVASQPWRLDTLRRLADEVQA